MTFARYPRMKPSGYEWIGEVPDHWKLDRLGSYFVERREKVSDRDFPPLSVTMNGIVPQLETAAKTDDGDNRKRVEVGDFVINSRSDRRGSSGLSSLRGSVSLINTVLKPRGVHGRYIHYLFKSVPFVDEYYRLGKGIVADLWSTNYSQMRLIGLAIPTDSEQLAIADFLDTKTSAIDNLIRKKERLIEVLQEKRQAVINRAVTKGLDPSVKMKDSGIAWLGEIPAHWQVLAFRRVCSITQGQVNPLDRSIASKVLIAPNHLESGTGRILFTETADAQGAISGKYPVRSGEVIYSKIRPALNKLCIAEGDWLCSADMYPIQPFNGLDASYLMYYMLSPQFVALMVNESMRVAMPKVNRETLNATPVVVPPLNEQIKIVATIKDGISAIDSVREKIDQQLVSLREYRQTLITAAVTGKIDVRQYVEKRIPAAQEEVLA